jgi:hypothetical protein
MAVEKFRLRKCRQNADVFALTDKQFLDLNVEVLQIDAFFSD